MDEDNPKRPQYDGEKADAIAIGCMAVMIFTVVAALLVVIGKM